MDETTRTALAAWESFYVIVGSSAGALTGLQFVVLTLVAESGMLSTSGEALSAFASPNVLHFCLALLVSAIFSAPWHGLGGPAIAVALCGVGGLIYSIAVLRRALHQRDYRAVLEDWIWHAVLPMLAYGALILAGILLPGSHGALFVVGGATLLLMFIGIHNAWDTVTYVVLERIRQARAAAPAAPAPTKPTPAVASPASGAGAEGAAAPPGPPTVPPA